MSIMIEAPDFRIYEIFEKGSNILVTFLRIYTRAVCKKEDRTKGLLFCNYLKNIQNNR